MTSRLMKKIKAAADYIDQNKGRETSAHTTEIQDLINDAANIYADNCDEYSAIYKSLVKEYSFH